MNLVTPATDAVCSVRRTECIAYIDISQVSQLFAELFAVLGLLCATETGILKKHNVAVFHCFYSSFVAASPVTSIIRNKCYFLAKLLGKTLCNRCKRLALGSGSFFSFSKVRAQDYLAAVSDQLLDRRKCCNDTCSHL